MIDDNLIIIKGGAYSDLRKALRQWIKLYSDDLDESMNFELIKNGRGNHIIKADKKLDNERFFYLINYLKYPENISYAIEIKGFTTGKIKAPFKGKRIQVYVSKFDTEFDNVLITTDENLGFKVDFGGKVTQIETERTFETIAADGIKTGEIFKPTDPKHNDAVDIASINSPKRFLIVGFLFILILATNFKINFLGDKFTDINNWTSWAFWGWLIFDYKLLQNIKIYLFVFFIAVLAFFYGDYLQGITSDMDTFSSLSLPIALLIIQLPTRLLYKALLKREPVVDKPPPTKIDYIYIFILWMGSIGLLTLYLDK